MQTFKYHINENRGLRFIYEKMDICSAAGRKRLLAQQFITRDFDLQMELDTLEFFTNFVSNRENAKCIVTIQHRLYCLNDIHQTIHNLRSAQVLDDIELYEIKNFSMTSQDICKTLEASGVDILPFHDLSKVVEILDPEHNGIQSFYIYSAYDEKLAVLRKEYDIAKNANLNEKAERIRLECIEIEDRIREHLSEKLRNFSDAIQANYDQLAYLDLLVAKAQLARDFKLCKPSISQTDTTIKGAFNPVVAESLKERGCEFQPIDLHFDDTPNLITGANMSGKTVVLKTMSLIQMMFQFGFFVPAISAEIAPVEEIMTSIGDAQSEVNGLSSFAIEMLNIDKILKAVKSGQKILALVDELARTTNPSEGRALVNAFIKILSRHSTRSLITTHYNGITAECNRLRVKGLKVPNGTKVTPENINRYMDYSLVSTTEEEVPTEGLTIAEIFGIDEEFLNEAKNMIL
ncbi:MAG: DNA mismatch repair protein MutS [Bacteroidales bacterium]|nr:DNA mismatch repair protein MutS [Bacteroidales bacterium]